MISRINKLLLFFGATLIFSCNNVSTTEVSQKLEEESKRVRVQLIDSLGIVSLYVPARYDTFFSWVHYSDCGKPCNERKYRYQKSEFPIIKESGWILKDEPQDSLDRFTISHSEYFPFYDGDTAKNIVRHNNLKKQLTSDPKNPPIIFDTIQKIDDRYYSIIVMEKFDVLCSKEILAATTIKSNVITFRYELLTRVNDSISKNFIKNSIDLIKTIQINKGV